ncbi:MAG: hypothetical protein QN163_06005 [Armatimonadota bacterium]|nr:hypothetical protein [Armatimonadota bacterium]MDR5697964.1 hypothetical protein [Armatimonadota bacterium]
MGTHDEGKVTRRGVVDRIEEEVAVIFLDGGDAAFLPRAVLPHQAAEGSGVEIAVRLVANPVRREVDQILDRLADE